MAINEQTTDNQTRVVMERKKRPLHAQIVSFGAVLLLSIVIIVILDLGLTAFTLFVGGAQAGLNLLTPVQLPIGGELPLGSVVLLITGIVCNGSFVLSVLLWVALKRKVFLLKSGRILQKLLVFFFCLIVFFVGGIGYGILFFFGAFLASPHFTVNWKKKQVQIYRLAITLPIIVWMILEVAITNGNVGFNLLPDSLMLTGASVFRDAGIGWVSFAALGFIIPLFLMLPRIFIELWKFRPNIESFWREFLYHPLGMVGLVIITSIVLMAVLAPWIAPYHWGDGSLAIEDLYQPPSAEHLLGTNHRGEDIFSRFIYGAQISLLVGLAASVTSVFLGTFIGLFSGYYGGVVDTILMRITDVFLCLPTLPLMLIFLVLFGQGLQNVIFVIALLGWTGTARMVRSEALSLRERPLTEAAHALGASDTYILFKHIMPNTFPLILANMILGVVNAILGEAGIAFLGFVDIHGQPSWGIILHWAWKNAALLGNKWWWFIPPGLFIMLTTLGFVFISHTADKVVNPRLRGRRG